jgi:glyoxylate reductase
LRDRAEVYVWSGAEPPPRDSLIEKASQSDALVCLLTDKIDGDLLSRCPRLRVIANVATGYDNIDLSAASSRGIAVTNTPGILNESTADFAFALLLAAARRVAEADRYVRSGQWTTWSPSVLLGNDVHGATLGIIGLGGVGVAMARRGIGFGMRVLYHSRTRKPRLEQDLGLIAAELPHLLAESDFVSLHVPLSGETRSLIGADELSAMKPKAILINTARGGVVDQDALVAALQSGAIAAAGLDVTDPEPLEVGHPLMRLDNVVLAPHIASASYETRSQMAMMAVTNCLDALDGKMPLNCVNPEAFRTEVRP